jgi:Icc-related predicted phosphoesterase
MKLQLVSDLHLEFNDNVVINNAGADILCLAGDICLAAHLHRKNPKGDYYRKFFDHVSKEFDQVLYIMGNHEHYSGRWNNTADWLRTALEPWNNITLLDNAWLNFGNVRIVGTSLWTDLNKNDPLTMMSISQMMNDYKAVTIERNGVYHKLRPLDTVEEHRCSVELIKTAAETWSGDVVVLGHHAPSRASIHERYRNDRVMNGAFCSELDELILDQENIKLWLHGHVHNCFDYMIGQCRVVCNPHGYPGETTGFNHSLIINV